MEKTVKPYFKQLILPKASSHKGQNGKLLIIGGSELFHAASKWSLDIASKFVDMVFYSSVPGNNKLVQEAKKEFWNGIVIPREDLENYIDEADCILIGPGMTRALASADGEPSALTQTKWDTDTKKITDYLLKKYPDKKWVIDAGALQMADPNILNNNCIITPHTKELSQLEKSISRKKLLDKGLTIVLKSEVDLIMQGKKTVEITGGNPGMTKGGTGDVLAGLIAALYCTHDMFAASVMGSYANKAAGDSLFKKVGPYYNATDLVEKLPEVFWKLAREAGATPQHG